MLWIGVAFCVLVGWRLVVVFRFRAHRNALEATGWTLTYDDGGAPGTPTKSWLNWLPQAAAFASQLGMDDPDIVGVAIPSTDDASLNLLSGLNTLSSLELQRDHLSEADIGQLASLSTLQVLNLSSDEIDDERLRTIASALPDLSSLTLASQRITDEGLAELDLPNLTDLDIQATRASGVGLRPNSVPALRTLALGQLTDDAALARAGQFKNLRNLIVYRGRVSDAGLRSLTQLTYLESLVISGPTRLTDRGVAALAEITSLNNVQLDGQLLTFEAAESLSELPRLKSLSLHSGNLDDAGLNIFQPGPELLILELRGTSISDGAFERFSEQFPEITIWR